MKSHKLMPVATVIITSCAVLLPVVFMYGTPAMQDFMFLKSYQYTVFILSSILGFIVRKSKWHIPITTILVVSAIIFTYTFLNTLNGLDVKNAVFIAFMSAFILHIMFFYSAACGFLFGFAAGVIFVELAKLIKRNKS